MVWAPKRSPENRIWKGHRDVLGGQKDSLKIILAHKGQTKVDETKGQNSKKKMLLDKTRLLQHTFKSMKCRVKINYYLFTGLRK